MLHQLNWLKTTNNGNFALSWLAATNLTAFRNEVKKGQLETVNIGRICDELRNVIKSKSSKNRISLYMKAQLTFGTVKIHERLVNSLFEDVSNFYKIWSARLPKIYEQDEEAENVGTGYRPMKRSAKQKANKKLPKRRKIQDNDENIQAVLTSAIIEDITLREIDLPVPAELTESGFEDDGFGDEEEFDGEISNFFNFIEPNVEPEDPTVGDISVDLYVPGMIRVSTPINENEEFSGFPEEAVSSIASPIPMEIPNFEEATQPLDEFLIPARKKRCNMKKKPHIDQIIVIPRAKMEKQLLYYGDTMRCSTARADIVDLNVQTDLLNKPSRKRRVECLEDIFHRNLKIPRVEDKILDFLVDIVPRDVDPNNNSQDPEEIYADVLEDFHSFTDRRVTRKRAAAKIPDPVSLEIPEIPPPMAEPVEEISVTAVQPNFPEIPSMNTNTKVLTKETILNQLQHLWSRKMNHINIKTLLGENPSRKIAAQTFMIVLELHKSQQVQIHGLDGKEITNITPGNLFVQ